MIDISCIVLSNLNDLFVKNRTIPSIIENSKSHSIEIIVVDNSPTQDFECDDVKVIYSEPYHIPKAYNKGVLKAQGKYVALFHDDCELNDEKWIEKSLKELNENVWMVGPELNIGLNVENGKKMYFLKEVPLIMEKDNFIFIGSYDETYFIGAEDFNLSKIVQELGKDIKKVDITHNHLDGMSTYLLGFEDDMRNHWKNIFVMLSLKMWKTLKIIFRDVHKTYRKRYEFGLYNNNYLSGVSNDCFPKTKEEFEEFLVDLKDTYNSIYGKIN